MERQKVVTDASVVAKWFLEEEFSESARLLRDSFVTGKLLISVPSLLFYETLNALRYTHLYSQEELASAARALSRYGFDVWEPSGRVYEEVARTSLKHDISVYDAAYVGLALHLRAALYTADLELVQKLPGSARHIRSFKPV